MRGATGQSDGAQRLFASAEEIRGDQPQTWPVVSSEVVYGGALVGMRVDVLADPAGDFAREVMTHPGAVAVVAVDSDDRVLVIRQYRHAAQRHMLELPAGLLDVEGEDTLAAAARELREEGQVEAEQWSELLTIWPSPGISEEVISVFLAQQIRPSGVPDDFVAEHEEATMTRHWIPLDELVEVVLSKVAGNGVLVAGSLALAQQRSLERLR